MTEGRILGHEAVGTIEEIGSGVTTVAPGDRVLVSCITACGRCRFCKEARYGLCTGGGSWILGHRIDGTQAEYVRVPFADTSTHRVPDGVSDEAVLMLADICPTSYEVGVLNGRVRPGDTVAVVGTGPIGLAAILTAQLFSPSQIVAIDIADSRLDAAKQFGAGVFVNNERDDALERIRRSPEGSVRTRRSRPLGSRRASSSARASCGRAVSWRTWACTGGRRRSISRTSGSRG